MNRILKKVFNKPSLIICCLGAVIIYVAVIYYREKREQVRRISCASNFKSIGLTLHQYAMDFNGCFPVKDGAEGLEILRKNEYLTDYNIFICQA